MTRGRLQLTEREGQPIVAVEAFVTGNYVKYSIITYCTRLWLHDMCLKVQQQPRLD